MANIKFHDDTFKVEVLTPPNFERSGQLIDRREAWKKGLWYGTFNLILVQTSPVPGIIYQKRSPTIGWAPGKLDVSCAGHYEDMEPSDAIDNETKEELGKKYDQPSFINLGKRTNEGKGQDGTLRRTVSDLYLLEDNTLLNEFSLQEEEVYALCLCPIDELVRMYEEEGYKFEVMGIKANGEEITMTVSIDEFPENWDDYHRRLVFLVKRYLNGEKDLKY
ncbi:hypothetical protein ACFLZ4_00535 [Patescibacteria group bacterium]